MSDKIPFEQRLTCSVAETTAATGLSRATVYRLLSDGKLKSVTLGKRRLVNVRSVLTLCGSDQRASRIAV